MKVLIQWTLNNPQDWVEIDSSAWSLQSFKPEPTRGLGITKEFIDSRLPIIRPEIIDGIGGWVFDLNVQGVLFRGMDHYAIEDLSEGIKVTVWNDDPEDWPGNKKWAEEWTFLPLAADPDLGGAISTHQTRIVYTDDQVRASQASSTESTTVKSWSAFTQPTISLIRHGIWISNSARDQHINTQTLQGWRDFPGELSSSELDSAGRVAIQRDKGRWKKALGTITYYQRDTNLATGVHVADNENALEKSTATGASETVTFNAQETKLIWSFTTQSSEPRIKQWPNGTYRCQLDVSASSTGINYALGAFQGASGHFGRVNTGLSSETTSVVQQQGAFTGTGLKLATANFTSFDGPTDDRFECLVAGQNTQNRGGLTLTFDFNTTDSFADGPWTRKHLLASVGAGN